jgi:hypothetical protein
MSLLLPSAPVAGAPQDPDEVRTANLETLIARLVAKQVSGQVGYWAAFSDERGVSHFAFTNDPAYADLSPENAASRTGAVAAMRRATERYCATLAGSTSKSPLPEKACHPVAMEPAPVQREGNDGTLDRNDEP